jgi:hypothetical protein
MAGLRMEPSSPPVQHTSTVWAPSSPILGDGGRPLGGLVVGVRVHGEDHGAVHDDDATKVAGE